MAADEALARVIAEQRQHDAQWHYAGNGQLEPPQLAAEGSRFVQLLRLLNTMHDDKGADYGDGETSYSNLRRSTRFGVSPYIGTMIRLTDKYERLVQLSRHDARVKTESVVDTLADMAVYCLLGIILYEEEHDAR